MNVLITGGASGLGEAITRRLAANSSWTVYFTYHSSEEAAKKITSDYSNTRAVKCNFKDAADVASLKEQILKLDIDILINNAYSGSFLKAHFHKTPSENFLSEFKDNVLPTVEITQSAILGFRKKKSGRIITILTSALINTPPIGASIYTANKAYMQALVKVWAVENARFNITSNSVSPAFMQTSFTKDVDDRMIEQIRENHPLKKLLLPQEAAEAVFFLCTAPNQINGTDLILNSASDIR